MNECYIPTYATRIDFVWLPNDTLGNHHSAKSFSLRKSFYYFHIECYVFSFGEGWGVYLKFYLEICFLV